MDLGGFSDKRCNFATKSVGNALADIQSRIATTTLDQPNVSRMKPGEFRQLFLRIAVRNPSPTYDKAEAMGDGETGHRQSKPTSL